MKARHIIVYTFQSLEDPLAKGLILEYILRMKESDIIFHFITHEQEEYKLSPEEKVKKTQWLKSHNIYWYPVNYKTGSFLLLKKLLNFIQTFFICLNIKLKHKPAAILGFLAIPGSFSYIISRLLSLKLIIYCFEPHSSYMVDFGIWKKNSLRYRLLKKFEDLQLRNADYLVVPTSYSFQEAALINTSAKKYMVPISVDTELFKFSKANREEIRKKINAGDKTVIIYTGKFGGIYYSADEIATLFKELLSCSDQYFLYVISPNVKEVALSLKRNGIPSASYFISDSVPYHQLHKYLSAGDIGLVAVPNFPSQKYRTPVKTGIYLSCGLPYMINKGVAEDDVMAENERVGIVFDDIHRVNGNILHQKITSLLSENSSQLKNRCINTAIKYRGIHNAVDVLKKITGDLFASA